MFGAKIIIKRRGNNETISFYGGETSWGWQSFMTQGGAIFIKYCLGVVGRFLSSLFHSFAIILGR
jgi:hypothetical protein